MAKKVPKKKPGESWVEYHDRLSAMIRSADEEGHTRFSGQLQKRAGTVAADHPEVREDERGRGLSGPGTYPWYECVDDQVARGYTKEQSDAICGRIRADSRKRYPAYWEAREKKVERKRGRRGSEREQRRAADNPLRSILSNPASDGLPFCGIALDGGPNSPEPRDNVIVVDRSGAVLVICEVYAVEDLQVFEQRYPGMPVFGPFHVLPSDLRDLRRRVNAPVVERRERSRS